MSVNLNANSRCRSFDNRTVAIAIMHDFHITLCHKTVCLSHRVLSEGAKWGCYKLVSVGLPLLEILSGGAEYPLDPVWRRALHLINERLKTFTLHCDRT